MNTLEAIEAAKDHQGDKIYLLGVPNTYIYTNDGIDYDLIINGSQYLGFGKEHSYLVDQDLDFYIDSKKWIIKKDIHTFKKEGKGHEFYLNGNLQFWVAGSLTNAKKEAKKLLNK